MPRPTAPGLVLVLPGRHQPRDRGRAQPGRPLLDDALRARLYQIRRPTEAAPGPARPAPEPARDRRALLADHVAAAASQNEAEHGRIWDSLNDRRRALIVRAVERDFADYLRAFDPDADPTDGRWACLKLDCLAREAVIRFGSMNGVREADGVVSKAV